MKTIYHAYNCILKRAVCIILALALVILSLLDCLGRASSFIARQEKTEAFALEAELTTSVLYYVLLSLGYTVDRWEQLSSISSDMNEYLEENAYELSDDWQQLVEDGVITSEIYEDCKYYIDQAVSKDRSEILTSQNAYSYFLAEDTGFAVSLTGAGLADFAKSYKRFFHLTSPVSGGHDVRVFPINDNIAAFVMPDAVSPSNWFFVTSSGSTIQYSKWEYYVSVSSLRGACYSDNEWVTPTKYLTDDDFYGCRIPLWEYSFSYDKFLKGTYGSYQLKLVGMPVYTSMQDYLDGKNAVPSYPDYGIPIDVLDLGTNAGFMDRIIGKSFPLDKGSIEDLINAGAEAAEQARSKAKEEGKDDAAAEEDAAAAAVGAITLALDKLTGDLNNGNKGIMGLLGMILAALTGTYAGESLFSLVKNLAAELSAYIKKMIDGTAFAPIVNAILSAPTGIIGSLDALPDSIGRVMHTVLTGLGLEDVFGNAIDGALDWVKEIPGGIAGAIDTALDWVKDIPGNLSGAIDTALGWVKDIPGSIAGSISDRLAWLLSLPGSIADAIADALERLRDLGIEIPSLDWILDWLTIDVFTVTNAMAAVRAIALEKLGLPSLDPFKPFIDPLAIEYPVIKMPPPGILQQFYSRDYIILIDFSDYQQYCQTARTLLRGICWFSFLLYIIKSHKVNLNIA